MGADAYDLAVMKNATAFAVVVTNVSIFVHPLSAIYVQHFLLTSQKCQRFKQCKEEELMKSNISESRRSQFEFKNEWNVD